MTGIVSVETSTLKPSPGNLRTQPLLEGSCTRTALTQQIRELLAVYAHSHGYAVERLIHFGVRGCNSVTASLRYFFNFVAKFADHVLSVRSLAPTQFV